MLQLYVCIPRRFLVINVCNQGKTLCSPCIILQYYNLMGPPSYIQSVVDRKVIMRRISCTLNRVLQWKLIVNAV